MAPVVTAAPKNDAKLVYHLQYLSTSDALSGLQGRKVGPSPHAVLAAMTAVAAVAMFLVPSIQTADAMNCAMLCFGLGYGYTNAAYGSFLQCTSTTAPRGDFVASPRFPPESPSPERPPPSQFRTPLSVTPMGSTLQAGL